APEAAIPTTGSGGGGTSAAGKVAGMGKFIGGGVAKVIIATVVGITATVGTILIVPKLSNSNTAAVSVTAPAIKQSPVPAPAAETGEQPSAPATTGNQNQSPASLPMEIQAPQADAARENPAASGRNVANVEGRKSSPEMRSSVPATSQTREKDRVKTAETATVKTSGKNEPRVINEPTTVPIGVHPTTINRN
ncbi:MAG: hypothetical protein ABI876_13515, partial [Bacteroidota bacterium]